jgi:hypothetical protein
VFCAGSLLITAGDTIQLWQYEGDSSSYSPTTAPLSSDLSPDVQFTLGMNDEELTSRINHQWICVWSAQPSLPIHSIAFSFDGQLFAAGSQVTKNLISMS